MPQLSSVETKITDIQSHCASVVGTCLSWYETAELLDNGSWIPWRDLPIRLYTDSGKVLAVSWSEFDTLWIRTDLSLPFPIDGSTIRWTRNSIEKINSALGGVIRSVMIGQGEMAIEGKEIEVWTRLLIQVGEFWLEIYNALDENGYDLSADRPSGNFIQCV